MFFYMRESEYAKCTEEELKIKFNSEIANVAESSSDDFGKLRACTQSELNNRFFNDIVGLPQVSLEFIQYMVDNGVNPRDGVSNKDDGFAHVCKGGSLDKVKYFIEKFGSDINANHGAPLYCAIRSDHYDVFEYLIGLGCKVNREHIKETLHDSHVKYAQYFMENGYKPKLFVRELCKYHQCEKLLDLFF